MFRLPKRDKILTVVLALFCAAMLFAPQLAMAAMLGELIPEKYFPEGKKWNLLEFLVEFLVLCVSVGVVCYGGAYVFEKIRIPILPRVFRVIGTALIGLIVVLGAFAANS